MVRFILHALIVAVGLWVAARLLHGVSFSSYTELAFAAILLGIVNALVRPVLFILTLPITIVTLGLFILVVNGLMVALVAFFLRGFHTGGLINDILIAIIVWLVSWVASWFIGGAKRA